jgi:hypothetical protein
VIAVSPDMPPPAARSDAKATLPGTGNRPEFDPCISWLRILMETTPRPSINTAQEPWGFAPVCSLAEVTAFERSHRIELPRDYARFITEVGNGTARGGAFGVFPLGLTVQDDGYGPPIEYRPPVADALRRPFQHGLATWAGGDFDEEIKDYIDDHGEPPPTFDAEVMAGALPIAYEGCGEWCYLALSGPEAGSIWQWANGWMSPVPTPWLRSVNFTEWVLGEVARQRGLIDVFRQLTGVTPQSETTPL